MSALRPTRKSSRMSSPFNRHALDSTAAAAASAAAAIVEPIKSKPTQTFMDKWVEPPLRNPAPSFEDYKGLERHGVLSQMAPLGTRPPSKQGKVKGKQDMSKRTGPLKGVAAAVSAAFEKEPDKEKQKQKQKEKELEKEKEKGRPVTPDQPPALSRRPESRKTEERPPKTPVPRDQAYEQMVSSKANSRSLAMSPTTRVSPHTTPNSRTQPGRAKMKSVVDAAVARAAEFGHHNLGLAVQKLYEESLHDSALAELLDAVLAQRATKKQAQDFQHYIKVARRVSKAENSTSNSTRRSSIAGAGSPSNASSKSPSKTLRLTAPSRERERERERENVGGRREATDPKSSGKSKSPRNEMKKTQRVQRAAAVNGTTRRSQANAKASATTRANASFGRSRSASSSSALSSVDSFVDDDPDFAPATSMEVDADHADGSHTQVSASAAPVDATAQLSGGLSLRTSMPRSRAGDNVNIEDLSTSVANSLKRTSSSAGLELDDADAALSAKRQRLRRQFPDVQVRESSLRASPVVHESARPASTVSDAGAAPALSTRQRQSTIKKREGEEGDELASPAPSLGGFSRAGTPNVLGRPVKKAKKTARVKMSPIKKKTGVIAGIARHGGRYSPVGYGGPADNGEDDNNDYCSACGGNGDLLCCDGCDNSFHFTCLDPPMNKDHLPETWFCYDCKYKRNPPLRYPRGLFSSLLAQLDKKNPRAYSLPLNIRDYFEGVKTGEEGEYEETVTKQSRTRAGYDEAPDLLKLKDSKGNFVLCYNCGKSSLNHQEIIQCDHCSLQWHLDCLDPPMANPPPRGPNGKPRNNWMCPNHVDHELLALTSRATSGIASPNGMIRTHKVRRPKNAKITDPALRRGFKNNGLIEIENDASDDDMEFIEEEKFGTVYRLPERGIKLDFIDAVKRSRLPHRMNFPEQRIFATHKRNTAAAAVPRAVAPAAPNEPQPQFSEDFNERSMTEQQAALNLAQFAAANPELGLAADEVENLLGTLIAEAPQEVVSMFDDSAAAAPAPTPAAVAAPAAAAAAPPASNTTTTTTTTTTKASTIPPSPPSSDSRPDQAEQPLSAAERSSLLMIQELIRRRLEGGAGAV